MDKTLKMDAGFKAEIDALIKAQGSWKLPPLWKCAKGPNKKNYSANIPRLQVNFLLPNGSVCRSGCFIIAVINKMVVLKHDYDIIQT